MASGRGGDNGKGGVNMAREKKERSYSELMYIRGTVWDIVLLAAMLAVPAIIGARYGVRGIGGAVAAGLVKVAPLFYVTGAVEVIAYTPLIGVGSIFLCFTTGNISNLKLPCALAALDNAGVRGDTEEGDVISTIAISTSAIVTTVILALFVLPLRSLLPYLTADGSAFAPALKNVVPALFGALGAPYFMKHLKISVFPVVLMCVILIFAGTMSSGNLLFVGVISSLLGAIVMAKLGKL